VEGGQEMREKRKGREESGARELDLPRGMSQHRRHGFRGYFREKRVWVLQSGDGKKQHPAVRIGGCQLRTAWLLQRARRHALEDKPDQAAGQMQERMVSFKQKKKEKEEKNRDEPRLGFQWQLKSMGQNQLQQRPACFLRAAPELLEPSTEQVSAAKKKEEKKLNTAGQTMHERFVAAPQGLKKSVGMLGALGHHPKHQRSLVGHCFSGHQEEKGKKKNVDDGLALSPVAACKAEQASASYHEYRRERCHGA
jgi:hypothetical protein